ncbi:acyltransferase [Halopseudomonas salina]|uniref:Acetyltransferase n=1 Tax=Halopseudomonas salina TaxID=1323744 RepID=A0ABQ1PHC9_9GAMM|nr:acyltransferase [Halopseudomonas salina]GGC97275.1 acetyltransferase [Halopseudomonas salina]
MKTFYTKIKPFIRRHGLILSIFRLPLRFFLKLGDRINTLRWRFLIKNIGEGSVIQLGVKIENPMRVRIGRNCFLTKGCALTSETAIGVLTLSEGVQINSNTRIDHTGDLLIGAGVLISENCVIYTHSHGYNPRSEPIAMPKIIGPGVWVGSQSIILENCQLVSANSIIAAGSVLTKSCTDRGIYGGVPAKLIKRLNE